jgi:hypothetical protein
MTVQMDTHILANDTYPNFLKCLSDKNTFETDPKVKKEKQREMTPQALRFSSSYYKFLTREDKRLVDSLVNSAR